MTGSQAILSVTDLLEKAVASQKNSALPLGLVLLTFEILIGNREQASICLKKKKPIQILTKLIIKMISSADERSAKLAKSIFRILSTVMRLDEAKSQSITNFDNSLPFVKSFVNLATSDWSNSLQKLERGELAANSLKTLRLLTEEPRVATRVNQDNPRLLEEVSDLIFDFQDYKFAAQEAKGLIFNMKQVMDLALPDVMEDMITGFRPEQE